MEKTHVKCLDKVVEEHLAEEVGSVHSHSARLPGAQVRREKS